MTQASQNQESESESVSQDPVELDTPTADFGLRAASSAPNASTPNVSVRPEPLLVHQAENVQVAHAQHHQISHSQAVRVAWDSVLIEIMGEPLVLYHFFSPWDIIQRMFN